VGTVGSATGNTDSARPSELLEREAELAAIDQALTDTIAGDGRLLIFEGPAGIGKTALLQEGRRRAPEAGLTVVWAQGSEFEGEFPYAVIRQLFEPLLRAAGAPDRERLLGGAAQFASPVVLSDAAEHSAPTDVSFAVVHGLYWLVANLASQAPLVLMIDDLHWADAPSLRFLLYLARRLESLPVSILVSVRRGDEGSEPLLLAELTSTPAALRSLPAPLSESAVADLLGSVFEHKPDQEFARACRLATGGNPLLVYELAMALVVDGVEPDAASLAVIDVTGPETIALATLGRLARLSEDAVRLAQAVAILGRDATLPRAARVAELDDRRALGALDILVAAEFVRSGTSIEFVHPIVRAAIYNELAPGRLTIAHRQIADLLVEEGGEIDATAGHLLLSQPIGSQDTIELLHRAATHAFGVGAPASAATYLARAIDEGPERELRAELLLELGLARKMAGEIGPALESLEQVSDVTNDPSKRTRAAIEAAMIRVFSGDWQRPLATIETALAELRAQDLDLLLTTEASLGVMMGYDQRLVSRLDLRLDELDELASTSGAAAGPLLMTLGGIGAMRGEANAVTRLRIEQAWDGGRYLEISASIELLPQGCYALLFCDELESLEWIVEAIHADAQARGSLMEFLVATTVASSLEARRGRLPAAEAELRVACEGSIENGYMFALPTLLWGGADVLIERPAAADVVGLLESLDPALMPNSFNAAIVSEVRGRLRFVAGDRASAVADLRYAGRIFDALHANNPNAVSWRSTLALMLDAADREEAIELVNAELDHARALGQARGIGVALRALGTLVGDEAGHRHLQEAVSVLAGSPARLEHARALVELGSALRRSGSRAAAREPLREGLELAARCGALRLLERARDELSASGAKPRRLYQTSRDALTPSELRVARLAAEGRSSREIAQSLFVTTRTIDAHLQHAYMKLGINSRKQLKDALQSGGPPPS
jgi:DNA-binding CsgD family transcriptional regulator